MWRSLTYPLIHPATIGDQVRDPKLPEKQVSVAIYKLIIFCKFSHVFYIQ